MGSESCYYKQGCLVCLKKVSHNRQVGGASTYKTPDNILLSTSDKLIVKFKVENNFLLYCEKYNIKLIKRLDVHTYLFKVLEEDKLFNTAKNLQNEIDIVYAHPDFTKKSYLR